MGSNIYLQWTAGSPCARFRTGVSLHSHTLHSHESLDFIYHAAAAFPLLAAALHQGERQYRGAKGVDLDLGRGWWTPPLAPYSAWAVETSQIEDLDLAARVSLTDHDDVEAGVALQVLPECQGMPVSVEWTVPFRSTYFHLGVHNLPRATARAMFAEMDAFRANPRESRLREIMTFLAAVPEILMIFNHPLWDEKGIGASKHVEEVHAFLHLHGETIHALELNGLRPWRENRETAALASVWRKPVVSGGDRHGLEPNAMLNLSNAASFTEFVDEVRSGWSDVLILRHYRESHAFRVAHNMVDILKAQDRHPLGWSLWSDRVFYRCNDGIVRSLTTLFGARTPAPVAIFVGLVHLASAPQLRRLLREAFSEGEKVAL